MTIIKLNCFIIVRYIEAHVNWKHLLKHYEEEKINFVPEKHI